MGFRKINSIRVSERVLGIVVDELDLQASEYHVKIDGWLETFNNCREQGFVLFVESVDWSNPNRTKDHLYIWAFENRNSDEIVIAHQTDYPNNGMYNEETWKERRKFFHYNQTHEAADYAIDLVKNLFKNEFTKTN